jgi:hypothetical protein
MAPHESLQQQLARLPRALPPARELWPAIEAAIRPAPVRQWPVQLAAGLLLATVSAALIFGLVRRPATPLPTAAPDVAGRGALTAASYLPPRDRAYRAARAALQRTFRERLMLLAPKTRARIEADLDTIQRATADIRAALQQDPASPLLQRLLASTWQQEFDLYRSVANSTDPVYQRS